MSLTELTGNPRHDQLLTLIADRGYMNIDELAQLLDVSTQTVRRDIRKLSEQGLITRHHGGAGRASSVVNTAFEQREVSLTEEKRAIAEAIADYIPDGSTIFITIGTTVEHVARALLNHNHLRIITNSLRVARIFVLVLLFSPALMTSADQSLVLAPSLLAFAFQLLMKAPLGMFKVALSWFLFGGIWLWLDALWQRQHGTSNS